MIDRSTPTEFVIGDRTFYVTRMPAFEALKAFGDLQKEITPGLGALLGAASGSITDALSLEAVNSALRQLSQSLDGAALERWISRLLVPERVSVDIDGEMQRLSKQNMHKAFDEFTDIIELLCRVLDLEFRGPLARALDRTGLAQRLRGLNRSGDTTTSSLPN